MGVEHKSKNIFAASEVSFKLYYAYSLFEFSIPGLKKHDYIFS